MEHNEVATTSSIFILSFILFHFFFRIASFSIIQYEKKQSPRFSHSSVSVTVTVCGLFVTLLLFCLTATNNDHQLVAFHNYFFASFHPTKMKIKGNHVMSTCDLLHCSLFRFFLWSEMIYEYFNFSFYFCFVLNDVLLVLNKFILDESICCTQFTLDFN